MRYRTLWSTGHCCTFRQFWSVQFDVGADQRGRHHEEVRRRVKRSETRTSRHVDAGSGPPSTRIRPEGVLKAVVESLEQALTIVDTSDEGPLVRSVTGRHVVRKVLSFASRDQTHVPPDFLQSGSVLQTLRFLPVGQIRVLWLVCRGQT